MSSDIHKDVLIVGQGIAGTLFSYICHKQNKTFDVVDKGSLDSASGISSGIINPITGRRYVKTWKYETLKEYFIPIYREMEDELNLSLMHEIEILRTLPNPRAQNSWDARTKETDYKAYMSNCQDKGNFENIIDDSAIGTITGAYRISIAPLLEAWRKELVRRDFLLEKEFVLGDIINNGINNDRIEYNGTRYKNIVFCSGAAARKEKLWNFVDFNPTKGEVLIVRKQEFTTNKILHAGVAFVPLEGDRLWIGSMYDRDFGDNEEGTEQGRREILKKVNKSTTLNPTVIAHYAGIRPTMRDMRPVIGRHPEYENIFLLNGLGAKGMSLGPYCARLLFDYIYNKGKIPHEIDIDRFIDHK